MPRLPSRSSRYTPPPKAHLLRLEKAGCADASVARVVLGLFDAIFGSHDAVLMPDYHPAINDADTLPVGLRASAHRILAWGARRGIVLNDLISARQKVAATLIQARRHSIYGRRRIRIANHLRAKHPPLKPDGRPRPQNLQSLEILGDEIGKPLGPGTIRRIKAFSPSQIEIRRYREPWYAAWSDRAVYVQLHADGYTIERIAMAVSVEPAQTARIIHGVLEDFFETGTEGVVWSVHDDDDSGYEGLHAIQEGDHLTILDQLGRRLWSGVIRCDRESGWARYPANPEFGQPCALGYWIHWTQQGFKPDEWARFFIRPSRDRLRAVLKKHAQPADNKR